MEYNFNDESVRYIGRWAEYENSMTATACGAKIQIAFKGTYALLKFNVEGYVETIPHLWIMLDGVKIESAVRKYIRVECKEGVHLLEVILKSAVETQNRWSAPLVARASFVGYEAESNATLPEFTKRTMEFVGDSITEGMLVDEFHKITKEGEDEEFNRSYQDDCTATYGYLTALKLGYEPVIMGYGASGVTKGGCGGVPMAWQGYPYCFEGAKKTYPPSDFVFINHGANDWADNEHFCDNYYELIRVIRSLNPKANIVCITPFKLTHHDDIMAVVEKFNRENNDDVFLISTKNLIEDEPLHPTREGHIKASNYIVSQLKNKYGI